ncbi:MAG: drug/metabolite transporter (DMT)-like permease [Janthinobacterium sp.]
MLVVTIAWGAMFPAMQDRSADFSPPWITCIRFALGVLLLPFL